MQMESRQILLIEDNPGDVELIRAALNEVDTNIQLTVSQNGKAATDFLMQFKSPTVVASRPDLILLDLNLPMRSGIDVLTMLLQVPSVREIPVIIFSSTQNMDEIKTCYSLGASSFIQKPQDFDDYLNIMRQIKAYWFETVVLPRA